MSKSLGNFPLQGQPGKISSRAIRFFMLSAHYRSPINFSEESLVQAESAVERLDNCWSGLQHAKKNPGSEEGAGPVWPIFSMG
ncbi:hypothetical protein MASR2M17_01150 [Aminivibrio sp.]